MSIDTLKKELGISHSEMPLGNFNRDFLEMLARIWSGALEKDLTAEDCAVLLAAPLGVEKLKRYRLDISQGDAGFFMMAHTVALPEN